MENRLARVTDLISGGVTEMVYDGDGARVLTLYPDDTWSATPGPHLEVTGTVTRSYYFLGSQRIAMRVEADRRGRRGLLLSHRSPGQHSCCLQGDRQHIRTGG